VPAAGKLVRCPPGAPGLRLETLGHKAFEKRSASKKPMESPCIQVCVLDEARTVCIGCGRTVGQIAAWSRLAPEERRRIMIELAAQSGERTPAGRAPARSVTRGGK
jgi:uncharacterized protein